MRRSRFAKAIETSDTVTERASIRETLWFDIHGSEGSQENSLAEWRVAGLDHIALLMGFTHILMTIGYVLLSSRKLRAVGWLLLAIGVGLLIQRFALEYGKRQLVEALKDTSERSAAQVFYDTLVGDLRQFELYALIVAIGVAVAIFLVDYFMVQKKLQEVDAAA